MFFFLTVGQYKSYNFIANEWYQSTFCTKPWAIVTIFLVMLGMSIDSLTHWGRVTHICVSKLTIIGSDNGLSPGRRQAIIWTNAGILLIGALGTSVSEILIKICTFSLKKMLLKMSSGKRRPSCLGLNVLTNCGLMTPCSFMNLGQHWISWWLVVCLAPSDYPN